MKKKKQFAPHIYPEWGELFENLTPQQNSEILLAIAKFPEYKPKDVPVWNFIKSQLQKEYEMFTEKCESNSAIIKNYWAKKKQKNTEVYERITDVDECIPKHKHKRITNNINININIPTKEEIETYANQQLCKRINADEFIKWYEAQGWVDKNGLPINWQQKVQSWVKRNPIKVSENNTTSDWLLKIEEQQRREGIG